MIPAPGEGLDLFLALIYGAIVLLVGRFYSINKLRINPLYKYYIPGLVVKIIAAICFGLVYHYYYAGGDTTAYHRGSAAMVNLFIDSPMDYLDLLFSNPSLTNWFLFTSKIGVPNFQMIMDPQTFFLLKLLSPIMILSFNYYFPATILIAWLTYTGIWKLFLLFSSHYPYVKKEIAVSVLFIPSVLFWGSGIMKDSITLAATCWLTYSFHHLLILNNRGWLNVLGLVLSSYILIAIKPYIFVALLPGSIIWLSHARLAKIKSSILRILVFPIIGLVFTIPMYFLFQNLGDSLGKYGNVESMVEKAVITQQDLKRSERYGSNSFDIGTFSTPTDMIKKAPQAIIAALFRPFIWEVNNVVMLLSGLENTILLLFVIYLFLRRGLISIINFIWSQPLLLFALCFSVFFAFAVGLTTANFGALVRYKIPAMPLFVSSLVIIFYSNVRLKRGKQDSMF